MSAAKARRQRERADEIRAYIWEIKSGPFAETRTAIARIKRLEAELAALRFSERPSAQKDPTNV